MSLCLSILTAVFFTLMGCEPDHLYDNSMDVGQVHTLNTGIAIHRTDVDTIFYLDGAIKAPKLEVLFKPHDAERIVWFREGPDPKTPDTLFALTEPKDPRNTDVEERLYRVKVGDRKTTKFRVGSRFDTIAFGPKQRFAILYHGATDPAEEGLYNPNEIALVDLTAAPGKTNPMILSVAMDGRKIDQVAFVPSIHVGGVERALAVFMAGSIVRVVDLDDPKDTWAKIPLLPDSDTRTMVPQKLIAVDESDGCDAVGCEAKLFVLASGTQDIYYITLGRSPNGFVDPDNKQLEAGGAPLDIAVVEDGDVTMLAALSQSTTETKINFIDIDTSAAFNIVIEDRLSRMTRIDGPDGSKLVIFGQSGYRGVYFLTLDGLVKERGRNLDRFLSSGTISTTVPLEGDRLLLAPGSGRDLILLSLLTEKADMLSSSGDYDWQDAEIFDDVFFLLQNSGDRIDFFALDSGSPGSLLLDDTTQSLHLIPGRKSGIALHRTPSGRATLFPLDDPRRAKAKVIDGLWFAGILDEEVAK